MKREPYDLDLWFGLSYASFCVLPRVLMKEMPAGWQDRMAKLLWEFDQAYDGLAFTDLTGIHGWQVRATKQGGSLTGIPSSVKKLPSP